jgi:hypothetical protein
MEMRHSVSRHSRTIRHVEPFALGAIFMATFAASPAFAYLDPGTGSMLLQLMLGGVAGAMVIGKLYLRRAQEFFRGLSRRRRPE